MRGRARVVLVLTALVAIAFATLHALAVPPTPDPAFLKPVGQVASSECTSTNLYENKLWNNTYGKDCRRLHFAFGPIIARPGQNDALIEPVTIEKPAYNGYIVRFRPDLVDQTGKAPDIAQVHLHHATWLNGYPEYGSGPFFAAGEEKTIATFPPGYGMHVGAADVWLLLYMVHNATATPHVVWITYDIDFIAEKAAAKHHIVPVRPVWLDVQRTRIANGAPSTGANPVFNVQQHFGHDDVSSFARLNTGYNDGQRTSSGAVKKVCTWPLENCAVHDVYGNVTPQQGTPISIPGADWQVPSDFEGTLIGIGGHLHPGGIRDEVSLVRNGVEKPIFISDAVAWQRKPANTNVAGGPKTSWDFSMGVTGSTIGWKVKIKTGDRIRLNAVYDSNDSSWYENMGIVVALLAPKNVEKEDAQHGGHGVDVFDQSVALNPGFPDTAIATPGWLSPSCHPNSDPSAGGLQLCLRGQVTHGHMAEASTFGGCPQGGCQALPAKMTSRVVDKIVSLGFTFGNADLGVVGQLGLPKVKVNKPLTFVNFDTAADIWHTFTGCAYPCTGAYGLDYPLANGAGWQGDIRDFDSTEIGYGLFFSPASGQFGGDKSFQQALQDGIYATFTPTQTGVYSLYCRIHPSMRGAFRVVN